MIYVVSGYRRSGTSMMMKALYEGMKEGQILYQPGQERIGSKEEEGYIPNPSGLHEVGQAYYMNAEFLRKIPDGSLVKILFDGLPNLPRGNYTVIYMLRDPEEIQASCDRVDKHLRQVGVAENGMNRYPWDAFRPYSQKDIDHVLGICEMRADIRIEYVSFRALVADPLAWFEKLSLYLPIDPEKSAAVVNPSYYRYRNDGSQGRDEGSAPKREDTAEQGIQTSGEGCQETDRQSRAV